MQIPEPASDGAVMRRGLSALVWDGVFSQALGVLAGGTFLTGCALELGASPFFIGLLVAIPYFAQLAHIPAVILVEKIRRRRPLCLASTLTARALLLPLVLAPLLSDHALGLDLILGAFALLTPLAAIGGCTWMSWTCDLVPHDRLGDVFGRRQMLSTFSGIMAALLGGAMLGGWAHAFPAWHAGGYAGIFALAVLAAMASTWCLTRMPEVPLPPAKQRDWHALFTHPFRDANFRQLMIFLGCWQFVANLVLPFFAVYLIQGLRYQITTAIALGIVSQLASIAALPLWGKLGDRYSNRTVIALCAPLFLACPIGWTLAAQPAASALALPIFAGLQVLLGAATGGLDLACGNIALKLAPRGEATVFLAANGLLKSLCAGCAPLVGGLLIDQFKGCNLTFALADGAISLCLQAWQIFFLITCLLGVLALTRLGAVKEEGDIGIWAILGWSRRRPAEAPKGIGQPFVQPSDSAPIWEGEAREPLDVEVHSPGLTGEVPISP